MDYRGWEVWPATTKQSTSLLVYKLGFFYSFLGYQAIKNRSQHIYQIPRRDSSPPSLIVLLYPLYRQKRIKGIVLKDLFSPKCSMYQIIQLSNHNRWQWIKIHALKNPIINALIHIISSDYWYYAFIISVSILFT